MSPKNYLRAFFNISDNILVNISDIYEISEKFKTAWNVS